MNDVSDILHLLSDYNCGLQNLIKTYVLSVNHTEKKQNIVTKYINLIITCQGALRSNTMAKATYMIRFKRIT